MQKQVKLPDGRIINVPEEATMDQILEFAQATMDKSQPQAPPSTFDSVIEAFKNVKIPGLPTPREAMHTSGRIAEGIRSAPTLSSLGAFGQQAAATPFDMLAHPRTSAPDALATGAVLATAPFTGGMSIPAGIALRTTLAGGAGFGGAKLRGDSTRDAILEGVKQAAFQGVPESVVAGLRGPAASGSRAATLAAIRPNSDVLNQVVDPNTGKALANYKERADVFAEGALDRGGSFSPASSGYHKTIKGVGDAARAEKIAELSGSPLQVSTQDILDEAAPDMFDLAGRYGKRGVSGEVPTAFGWDDAKGKYHPGAVDNTVSEILSRSRVGQGPLPAGSIEPPMVPVSADEPWTMLDVDEKAQGLGKSLAKDYQQQTNVAATRHGAISPEVDRDTEMILNRALRNITKRVPGVDALDTTIARNVPYETAAHDATMPAFSELFPRIRAAMGSPVEVPKMSLFSYGTRKSMGGAARPLRNFSRNATGKGSAQLARLIDMLMNADETSVSAPMNAPGVRR